MNPMLRVLNARNASALNNAIGIANSLMNPNAMMNQLNKQNPLYQQAMRLVQENNGNDQAAFYNACKMYGVDPNFILSQIPNR